MRPSTHDATTAVRTRAQRQALRLRRFGMASSTYALGIVVMALSWWLGLFPARALADVAALFVLINLGLLAAFVTGWNERFSDPSLTGAQVYLAVTTVAVIQVLGRDMAFVATPFYSVIFMFAMLQLNARQLAGVAAYVLVSYGIALLLRREIYAGALDQRVEIVGLALVTAGAVWFAAAATYISTLRGRLRASLRKIAALAAQDALTGLWNRRQIDLELDAAIRHARRHGEALCVALIDVDHFKRINDRHGHATGDEVLMAVAGCLAASLRAGDHVGRYGGEEFLLVLPATTMAQASALAERLRSRLETLGLLPADERPVTASFGLAAWRADEAAADTLRRADQALYRAKAGGRNRVVADSLFGMLA